MLPFRPALLALLLALPLLGGCFQIRALLRLNADGSGTIEETAALSSELRVFTGTGDGARESLAIYDEDALRARAADLGTGVTFVGVDTLDEAGFFGYRAVYRFDDVRRVAYSYNERPFAPGTGEDIGEVTGNRSFGGMDPDRPITFDFAPGRLTVRMPAVPEGRTRPAALDPAAVAASARDIRDRAAAVQAYQQDPEGPAAMLRQMLDASRLGIAVELPAVVTGGTAAHAEGTTLTLSDFSFGALFDLMGEKPELFARAIMLEQRGTPDPHPLHRALAARPGVRYELQPEVTVSWGE